MDVKKTVKVLLKCLACLILLAGVSLGGFFLGKATVPKPLSWTETDAFVATVVDYQGDFLLVQGAPINDGAHQGQFSFSTEGVPLWWHGRSSMTRRPKSQVPQCLPTCCMWKAWTMSCERRGSL